MFITAMASFAWANVNPTNYIGGVSFRPERDIPNLSGKVVLVTGGNTGLGKESIRQILARNPAHVFLAARSEQNAKAAIEDLKSSSSNANTDAKLTWLPLDLSSTKSVQDAAGSFKAQSSRLDILILNAGVMSLPPGETDLGHEIQLGTNHTGHFLLTKLLLPTLLRTAEEEEAGSSDVRVVSLSSIGHNLAPSFETILDQKKLKRCNTHARYGASKVANILFAAELARRYPSIMAVSVHPGLIATDLYAPLGKRNPVAALGSRVLGAVGTPVEAGARNQLWAAVGAKRAELVNGAYYVPVGNCKVHNRYVRSEEMGKELWEWTEKELRKGNANPSTAPGPDHKEGFLERTFQPHHAHHEQQQQQEQKPVFERRESQEEMEIPAQPKPQHHRRRSSTLQRLKEYMGNQDELDEAGKTYAKLM
ncbi:hypothetical protein BJY01DRAFT_239887 [Aspergillus pseudoustus]|uniref:Short-chain dehydrogenase/reductase family protein n=1 Tax=Aspergillus pseudoustus TaxID=1810923 RepID=A0ABR4IWT4_9EURO